MTSCVIAALDLAVPKVRPAPKGFIDMSRADIPCITIRAPRPITRDEREQLLRHFFPCRILRYDEA